METMPDQETTDAIWNDPRYRNLWRRRYPVGNFIMRRWVLPLRCFLLGGHCWAVRQGRYLVVDYDNDWLVMDCRHCGLTQGSRRQPPPVFPAGVTVDGEDVQVVSTLCPHGKQYFCRDCLDNRRHGWKG